MSSTPLVRAPVVAWMRMATCPLWLGALCETDPTSGAVNGGLGSCRAVDTWPAEDFVVAPLVVLAWAIREAGVPAFSAQPGWSGPPSIHPRATVGSATESTAELTRTPRCSGHPVASRYHKASTTAPTQPVVRPRNSGRLESLPVPSASMTATGQHA